MDTHDTLGMEKMHAVANLAILQEACKARTQIVKIGPGARDDESSLQLLATHLKTKLSVGYPTSHCARLMCASGLRGHSNRRRGFGRRIRHIPVQ
jgi:hypothetical protein